MAVYAFGRGYPRSACLSDQRDQKLCCGALTAGLYPELEHFEVYCIAYLLMENKPCKHNEFTIAVSVASKRQIPLN